MSRIGRISILLLTMTIWILPVKKVFADKSLEVELSKGLTLGIELICGSGKLCNEDKSIEYVSKKINEFVKRGISTQTIGKLEWQIKLLKSNTSWTNGLYAVYGESKIGLSTEERDYAFGLNHTFTKSKESQWELYKATLDTHIMYLFLEFLNIEKLSADLNHYFDVLTDDHRVYADFQNQLIIAGSKTEKDILLNYLDDEHTHDLLKAICASALSIKGDAIAKQYLDKELFERLSMSEYYSAAVEKLNNQE